VGRGEVLELVDEEVAGAGGEPGPEVGVGQQGLHRAVHLVVEVHRPQVPQGAPVAGEGVGQARHVVALGLDVGRIA
jgi:hypothetical protein